MARGVVFSADDFGLTQGVNEAVERACREGVLTQASLMVAGPAAADAVRRAKALPQLRVGLHVVAVEGPAMDSAALGDLVDGDGQFGPDQLGLALRYRFDRGARRRLAHEVMAQYRAFAATGLTLDHANAHKHMHLHPTVGRLLIEAGREHGLRAIRVPAEPPWIIEACGTKLGAGARALYLWTRVLRRQARLARLHTAQHCFGIAWSGHMTADRLVQLAAHLPPGECEIYTHPATSRDGLTALMPEYEHEAELAALLDPKVRQAFHA